MLTNRQQELLKANEDIASKIISENRDPSRHEQELIADSVVHLIKCQHRNQGLKGNPFDDLGSRSASFPSNIQRSKFKSLGECLQAVVQASVPGKKPDERLYEGYESRTISGMGGQIPSDGGFLLHADWSTQLLAEVYKQSDILNLCKKVPIAEGKGSIKFPKINETSRADGSRWGGVRGYWLAEGSQITSSKPKIELEELTPKKVCVLVYVTDELVSDVASLENYVRLVGTEELIFKAQDAVINGTGAGQPLGVLNSPCLISVSAETGQSATTIIYENVVKMWSRMAARSRKTACWLINQDIEPQLYSLSLVVGAGGVPVYMPAGGLSQQPYATLFGRPVIPIEQCSTLGTLGDILLCDLQSYLLAESGSGIRFDESIHVRFDYDESLFRLIWRLDGQPSWSSAITPYKGTNTVSPFIGLASRT